MKKAKKRRRNEEEEDSSSELERKPILASHLRQTLASRRHRMPQIPRIRSGGGQSSGGHFIHHNFRYGPEPPAYKTPKPEYPSYPKREPERPPTLDRYVVREKSTHDKLFERFMRQAWKDWAENDELHQEQSSEVKTDNKMDELSDITSRDLAKAERILQQQSTEAELQPLIDYFGKKRQELAEAEFDPERLLRQLEANPTEELRDKALAELNREPKFVEEEVEGSKVETDRISPMDLASGEIEQYGARGLVEAEPNRQESGAVEPDGSAVEFSPELNTAELPSKVPQEMVAEIGPPISEVEMLSDIQDLMHELEPEIEEQEEVEPSY